MAIQLEDANLSGEEFLVTSKYLVTKKDFTIIDKTQNLEISGTALFYNNKSASLSKNLNGSWQNYSIKARSAKLLPKNKFEFKDLELQQIHSKTKIIHLN